MVVNTLTRMFYRFAIRPETTATESGTQTRQESKLNKKLFQFLISGLSGIFLVAAAGGQDILITQAADATAPTKRRGIITQWLGKQITLESSGRARLVDSDTVIDLQTQWPDSYTQAVERMEQQQFAEAIPLLQAAITAELRPWARRAIGGKLLECLIRTGNEASAIGEFVTITREDPETRFFNLAPLPWVSSVFMGNISNQAAGWMQSNDPIEKLMGAAWSMSGNGRQAAVTAMKELSGNENPCVAGLAKAQLWRTQSMSASPDTIQRWESQLNAMPPSVRAGAYLMLADAQSRNELTDAAAINLMRIAVLHPEQHGLAAAALYRCADLRQNAGRLDQSRTLWAEVVRNYENTIWAKQASAKLNESNSKN